MAVTLGIERRIKNPAYSLLIKERRFERAIDHVLKQLRKLEKALGRMAENETCFLACGDEPVDFLS